MYNETEDEVYLSYTTAPGNNINKGLLFDQKTGKVSQTGMILRQPFYQPTRAKLMGTGETALYTTEGYRAAGSRWTTQIAETIPITPVPGDECTFGRIILQVKAVPIVAFVPPTLKVEFALDESVDWKTKYVDLTRDFISKGEGNTPIIKTVYVPVQDRAGSVKIRVSTVDNVASLDNGVEIYGNSVEVINEAYEQEEKKNYAVDRKAE